MKYLLLLALLVAVFWYLGAGRRARSRAAARPSRASKAVEMVRCAHCGLHLPRGEALTVRSGVFCDAAHREAFEASQRGDHAA